MTSKENQEPSMEFWEEISEGKEWTTVNKAEHSRHTVCGKETQTQASLCFPPRVGGTFLALFSEWFPCKSLHWSRVCSLEYGQKWIPEIWEHCYGETGRRRCFMAHRGEIYFPHTHTRGCTGKHHWGEGNCHRSTNTIKSDPPAKVSVRVMFLRGQELVSRLW